MRFDLKAKSSGRWAALAAVCVIGLAPVSASASDNPGADFGLGLGSFVTSLIYAPVKLVYATGGVIFGGFGWVLSGGDTETAKSIIDPAVRGDYIVTPDILRGNRKLEFFGERSAGSREASSPDW